MQAEDKSAFRAGLFIIAAVAVLTALIFTMGSKQGLFGKQYRLQTAFNNVQGLVEGAPVRLAGVKVGTIETIRFPNAIGERIRVSLRIDYADSVRQRIRGDSVASIRSLGALGEKYIEVSVGSEAEPILEDGQNLKGADPVDFYSVMDAAKDEYDKLTRITSEIERSLTQFRETKTLENLGRASRSLGNMAEEVEKGDGLLHSLVYDPKHKRILDNIASVTQSFGQIAREVAEGNGSLHDLIYKKEVAKISQNLSLVSDDLHGLLKDIRHGDGSLHSLIYGNDVREMVADLKAFAETLNKFATQLKEGKVGESLVAASQNIDKITRDIAEGKGAIGALLTDPTLYEQTEQLLGGAQRSWMLRRMIHKAVKDGKKAKKGE